MNTFIRSIQKPPQEFQLVSKDNKHQYTLTDRYQSVHGLSVYLKEKDGHLKWSYRYDKPQMPDYPMGVWNDILNYEVVTQAEVIEHAEKFFNETRSKEKGQSLNLMCFAELSDKSFLDSKGDMLKTRKEWTQYFTDHYFIYPVSDTQRDSVPYQLFDVMQLPQMRDNGVVASFCIGLTYR
jgi:hypothetical protein